MSTSVKCGHRYWLCPRCKAVHCTSGCAGWFSSEAQQMGYGRSELAGEKICEFCKE